MGLFSKKPTVDKKRVAKDLAQFHKENGDMRNSFYFSHKDDVDKWERRITESRLKEREAKDTKQELKYLNETKAILDSFYKWCCKYAGGETYSREMYFDGPRSMSNRVDARISELNKRK